MNSVTGLHLVGCFYRVICYFVWKK